jgi:hypothetical protein
VFRRAEFADDPTVSVQQHRCGEAASGFAASAFVSGRGLCRRWGGCESGSLPTPVANTISLVSEEDGKVRAVLRKEGPGMREAIEQVIGRLSAPDESLGGTKSALSRFIDRKRDYVDPALYELASHLRGIVEADVVLKSRLSVLAVAPQAAGARNQFFIRFELEEGQPGLGEVVHVHAEWEDANGIPCRLDEKRSIDEIDRERVDDYLEQIVPAALERMIGVTSAEQVTRRDE